MATKKKTSAKKMTAASAAVKKTSTGKTTASARPSGKSKKGLKVTKPAVMKKVTGQKETAKEAVVLIKKGAAKQGLKIEGRLQELRKDLTRRKEAIIREAKEEISKYISGENRQLVDTALDDGDWAVVDVSEDLNLSRFTAHRKTLHDIDESLRKIGEGTYGICEECGEEISEKRLLVLPSATLCLSCQENKERREAIEKEEMI